MKKIIFVITCCIGFIFNVQAASVGTMKIFTGNNGGVVTVQKRLNNQAGEEDRAASGLVTLSDIRLNIFRNNAGESDEEIINTELPEVADEISVTDNVQHTRISGRARFYGEQIIDVSKKLTLNGIFKSIIPQRHTLELQDIMVEVINGELVLSGVILINEQEFEINVAPEATQTFVRRLVWLIRKS